MNIRALLDPVTYDRLVLTAAAVLLFESAITGVAGVADTTFGD